MDSVSRWSLDGSAVGGEALEGVGVFMQQDAEDPRVYVKKVVPGGSAAKSGRVEVGDIIIRVNNESVLGETVSSLRRKIVGPPGSSVVLGFRRGDMDFDVRLTRGSPEFLSANASYSAGNVVSAVPRASEMLLGRADPTEIDLLRQRVRQLESQRDSDRLEIERLRSLMSNNQDSATRYIREIDGIQHKHSEEILAMQAVLNKSEQQRRELEGIIQGTRGREEELRIQLTRVKDVVDQKDLQIGEMRRALEEERSRLERELVREREARREEQMQYGNAEGLLGRMQEQLKRAKEVERARVDREERIKSHINEEFSRLNEARLLEEKIMGQTQELHLMLNKWESDFFSGMAPPAVFGERALIAAPPAVSSSISVSERAGNDDHYFMA